MEKKQWVKTVLIAAAFGVTALARPALAKDDACADDKQKFCSDVDASDHKAMYGCLKQHKDDVSDGCKKHMASHKGHMKSSDTPAPAAPAGGATSQPGS